MTLRLAAIVASGARSAAAAIRWARVIAGVRFASVAVGAKTTFHFQLETQVFTMVLGVRRASRTEDGGRGHRTEQETTVHRGDSLEHEARIQA
jgi:hypothetical protein